MKSVWDLRVSSSLLFDAGGINSRHRQHGLHLPRRVGGTTSTGEDRQSGSTGRNQTLATAPRWLAACLDRTVQSRCIPPAPVRSGTCRILHHKMPRTCPLNQRRHPKTCTPVSLKSEINSPAVHYARIKRGTQSAISEKDNSPSVV